VRQGGGERTRLIDVLAAFGGEHQIFDARNFALSDGDAQRCKALQSQPSPAMLQRRPTVQQGEKLSCFCLKGYGLS
jgi:hypothetical protein